jgi:pyruvyl transferase EpsO
MYHGAAMAAVAYALAPNHGKVYIASSNSYVDLHTWGSHPLLDPLWSTEAVQIVHDGGETRMNKLRALVQYPEAVARLRVCWRNPGSFNCGHCEKCVRTMLALRALGVERCAAFPDILTPNLVSQQNLDRYTVRIWRELLGAGLPPNLNAAVRSAMPSSIRGLDDDVVIICQGGGNFGDLYPFFHESRERVIKLYPNNPIVILPQTVYFNSQDRLGQSMKIFREHRNCHIFARDAHSLEILQRAGIHRSSTMPDMAQYLWRSLHPDQLNCYEEQPMRFVRRDKEFKPSAILRGERRREQTYDWPIIVSRKNSRQARMVIAAIQKQCEFGLSYQKYWQWHPMQERAIRDGVRFFSNFRKIYTNRLHAMILGLLLEREVCAFDNSYGKLSSYRNCWLSGMESLTWEPEE